MKMHSKWLALGAGVLAITTAAATAQDGGRGRAPASAPPATGQPVSADTIVVIGALEWHVRSDLAAKREGVLAEIKVDDGSRLEAGELIGRLDDDVARVTVEKQKVIAESRAMIEKAEAQRGQAMAELARLYRLASAGEGYASQQEIDKAKADVNYADALKLEAEDKQKADYKELALAQKILEQHQIVAPFRSVVIRRMKNPGEAVAAHEAVVRLGQTDRFKFVGWISLEDRQRVREGDVVQFRPIVDGSELPIEAKTYEGRVVALGSEIPQVGVAEVNIIALIENPHDPERPELELTQGLKGELLIYPSKPVNGRVAQRPAGNR